MIIAAGKELVRSFNAGEGPGPHNHLPEGGLCESHGGLDSANRISEIDPISDRLNEVRFVAVEVKKDGHLTVGLHARRLHELHTAIDHQKIITLDVIRLKEKEDPSAGLVPDTRGLFGIDSPRHKELGRSLA